MKDYVDRVIVVTAIPQRENLVIEDTEIREVRKDREKI